MRHCSLLEQCIHYLLNGEKTRQTLPGLICIFLITFFMQKYVCQSVSGHIFGVFFLLSELPDIFSIGRQICKGFVLAFCLWKWDWKELNVDVKCYLSTCHAAKCFFSSLPCSPELKFSGVVCVIAVYLFQIISETLESMCFQNWWQGGLLDHD